MAKILIGKELGSYTFDKVAKTITFYGFTPLLESFILITDVTNGLIIYQFNDPSNNGSLSGQVLTLDYDTNVAGFANTDKLQIYYWSEQSQQVELAEIGYILKNLLASVQRPSYASPSGRLRVELEGLTNTITTVTTVGTVQTVSSVTAQTHSGVPTQLLAASMNNIAWATNFRTLIN